MLMPIESQPFATTRGQGPPPGTQTLLAAVVEARAAVARERQQPRGGDGVEARVVLLEALEAYAACLAEHRCPIPYAMRDELRIQRLMAAPRR